MINLNFHTSLLFHIALILLLLRPQQTSCLGTGSTISISSGANTICAILAGSSQAIQCYRQGQIIEVSSTNVSYDVISGGQDFFCGLTSGGFSLHCWDTSFSNTSFQVKTLYDNATAPLSSISVGEHQICALHSVTNLVQCWKRGSPPFGPPKMKTQYRTITSGGGFSCGIEMDTNLVSCWGASGTGDFIESQFGTLEMLTLVAGKSHACGLSMSGMLICKGSNTTGQLNVPLNEDLHFSSIALGVNHTCSILTNNGSVICWGGDNLGPSTEFMKFVVASFSFESIVAGLDFTCGIGTDLSIICWGSGWPTSSSFSMSEIPLPKVIPGPCVNDACGTCGSHPNSTSLCATKGLSICKSCLASPRNDTNVSPSQAPSGLDSISPRNEASSSSPKEEDIHWHWAYVVFGSFGMIIALISLFFVFRRHKSDRQTRSMLESKDSSVPLASAMDLAVVGSNPSSAPHSRSSSITHSNSSPGLAPARTNSSSRPGNRAEKFSFGSLSAATENFSSDNIVGSGSFGTVYKGRLSDGRPVAIKREKMKPNIGNDIAFDSELELLSRLHHKHLVGLVGFCQEHEERLLVYEFMTNGALHDHLHNEKGDTTLKNSWTKRIKVGLDAARGIEYLHNYAVPPIIHRDIKSSNILIDSNWIARVSDFGLSLMGSPSEPIDAVGTVGYIDPEYYVLKVLTTKSDVYGFGVVLLELLAGKKAVFRDSQGPNPMMLVEYAGPYILGGEVWKILDKRVGYPLLNQAEAVELVAYTALRCVSLEAKERPTMSEVVANLEKSFNLCKDNAGLEAYSRTVSSASYN